MRTTYTHLTAQRWTKEKLVKEILKTAERCGKTLDVSKLMNISEDKLYNKYLSYRNKYILFYKKR